MLDGLIHRLSKANINNKVEEMQNPSRFFPLNFYTDSDASQCAGSEPLYSLSLKDWKISSGKNVPSKRKRFSALP